MNLVLLSQNNTQTAIRLYPDYDTWSRCPLCNSDGISKPDRSKIVWSYKYNNSYHTIFIVGAFPARDEQIRKPSSSPVDWDGQAIAWHVLKPSRPKDRSCWKSTEHFSTLPYGWIPKKGADFFALFVRQLKAKWLDFGAAAQSRLSQYVSTTYWSDIDMILVDHSVLLV